MTDTIKKNAKNILKQDRYHYVLVIGNKTSLLSSNNSKSEAKKLAINKLIEKTKDIQKFNNKIIYRLTIRKVSKEEKKEEKESVAISYVGGPIVTVVDSIKIFVDDEDNVKFENLGELGNAKVFINNKFLKKYDIINSTQIKKIVYAYDKNVTNCAFAVNKITDVLKNV